MSRKLTKAAIVFAALCGLGAASAPTALAVAEFTAGATFAAITGEQKASNAFEITTSGGSFVKVKCSEARLEGTLQSGGSSMTLTPIFASCTLGGLSATVRPNGCKFVFTNSGVRTGIFEILGCTAGKTYTIATGNCTISLPEQLVGTISYANEGSEGATMDALATLDLTTLRSTQTGSECPSPGLTSEDTHLVGTMTFKAFKEEGTREVTKQEHTYSEVICGTQVSFTVD